MNITTADTFDEIEDTIQELAYPKSPIKPSILAYGKNPTAANYRTHADAMESYEQLKVEYENRVQAYRDKKIALEQVWRNKLREEHSNLNDATFELVYAMAYERGHSSGYYEIRNYMDDLDTFATNIIKANQ